ncbi:hypothetical protein [Diaphorobacter nitroreducens]
MTRDEVIAMACEADFDGWLQRVMLMAPEVLERFAALVAVAEREACAALCEDRAKELLGRPLRRQQHHGAGLGASLCADAIRSRSTP